MQQRRRLAARAQAAPAWLIPALTTLFVVALIATAVFGGRNILQTQAAGTEPVSADQHTTALSTGENVVIDDAAIATQGSHGDVSRTVKEFTSDEPFSMFALTWHGPADVAAFVRAEREDGAWSEWYSTHSLGMMNEDGKTGTELIYIEPTTRVQVNVSGVDLELGGAETEATAPAEGAQGTGGPEVPLKQQAPASQNPGKGEAPADETPAEGTTPLPSNYGDIRPVVDAETPAAGASAADADAAAQDPASQNPAVPSERLSASDVEAVFIDGNAQENGINQVVDSGNTSGMPEVISRAGWGADESLRCSNPTYAEPVSAVTVHHTAGSNNYSEAQAPGIVRGIYQYHAATLGWCDVGYAAMVDKYGNIYEGRAGGMDRAVVGAHVGGFNQNTWGISMLGNYETTQPTPEAVRAMGELAGWKAAVSGFHPKGTDTHVAEFSFGGSKYAQGQSDVFPNINAHRDFHYDACPGQYLYAQMDTIRNIAEERYNAIEGGVAGGGGSDVPSSSSLSSTADASSTTSAEFVGDDGATTHVVASEEPTESTTGSGSASQEPGPAEGTVTDLISGVLAGDQDAILAAGATVAATVLSGLVDSGAVQLPAGSGSIGDLEIIGGLTVSDLPPLIDGAISLSGDTAIEQKWNQVSNTFGAVLGQPTGGIGGPSGDLDVALFDDGMVLDSEAVGTRAIWGGIADAWASQGFDLGPLGLPLNEEYADGDKVRVDFQGGYITYDPATHRINIHTS